MIGQALTDYAIVSIISFVIGTFVGWAGAEQIDSLDPRKARTLMAFILLGLYAVSVLAEIVVKGYTTPLLLHAIVGGIIGYLFNANSDGNLTINIGP
jgi:hypothetical protein